MDANHVHIHHMHVGRGRAGSRKDSLTKSRPCDDPTYISILGIRDGS